MNTFSRPTSSWFPLALTCLLFGTGCQGGGTASETSSALVGGTGLKGEYFDDMALKSLKLSRVDRAVDFSWGTGSPDAALPVDSFSARWTGMVTAAQSETYTFFTKSDDGVRLWVNNTLVIDNWTNHSVMENRATVALVAGAATPLRLEYYENKGLATMQLSWSSKSQSRQVIPSTRLSPPPTPTPSASCFPFDASSTSTLRASGKKVFAHYFSQFPISVDNKPSIADEYVKWMSDAYSANSAVPFGGWLRDRPLPQAPSTAPDWKVKNLEIEIRRAIALGLDGFTYDMLNLTPGTNHWDTLINILTAANNVDPGFKIVLMPDMNANWAQVNPESLVPAIKILAKYPALYRDNNNAIVVSPFNTDNKPASWWKTQLASLSASGISTAFMPLTLYVSDNNYAALSAYGSMSFGFADWGAAFASAAGGLAAHTKHIHDSNPGKLYMFPITPQSFRPNQSVYWEANNSQTLQAQMKGAIDSGADWIQFVTWNDYSENAQISPSVATGYAFHDLAAYYLRWFKTGTAPAITADALYYFHRNSLASTPPRSGRTFRVPAGPAPSDDVELVAFLTAPATLQIQQGPLIEQQDFPAGLQSYRVALKAGGTPLFRLLRNGAAVTEVTSTTPVQTSTSFPDLVYHGGTSVQCTRP